jgi:hypothetical protein
MGKHGGKHRKGRIDLYDGESLADEADGNEAAAATKVHRKSKYKASRDKVEEGSGPSKYLLAAAEEGSVENKHALYQRAVQVSCKLT